MARAVAGRGTKRLLIAMPPRHGKSELTSVWTPAWFLANWPHKRVILASYADGVAQDWGRRVRNLLEDHADVLGVRLAKDSKAAGRWNTRQGGGMLCAGVGGMITGKGADLFLVDDPVKNPEQANSVVDRAKKEEWWRLAARTRLEPGATVAMIQTRWHEADLMGNRLKAMAAGTEQWTEIRLPAIALENDPLGRKPGAPLWPERYDLDALASLRTDVGPYGWQSLFQQDPQPLEGGIFKAHWFKSRYTITQDGLCHIPGTSAFPWSAMPVFCTLDPALKEKELVLHDAYTAICVWGVAPSGQLLLLHVLRDRMGSPDMVAAMLRLNRFWKPTAFWVEKAAIGTGVIQWARKAGIRCRELEADKDKATRALAAAPSCDAGRVLLPHDAEWMPEFMKELLAAPTGTFWDQVDAFAYGVRVYDENALSSWPLWGGDRDPKPPSMGYADAVGAYPEGGDGHQEKRRSTRREDDIVPDDEEDDRKARGFLDDLARGRTWRKGDW